MPVVLVGAIVNGKPNFMSLAWTCIVEHKPSTDKMKRCKEI